MGSFGCADLPLGRQVIADVNAIIDEAGPVPPYRRFYEHWLDDASKRAFVPVEP